MARTKAPRVSVLLPIHNAESTLPQALTSLLRQDCGSFEIIAVDDGSTDDTPIVLREFARRDERVRPLFEQSHGLIGTLNRGLEVSRGDLIARMDADDIVHPARLRSQVDLLDESTEIDVASSLVRCFPLSRVEEGYRVYESWLNGLVTPEDIAREIFIESPVVHPSVLVRREAIERVGGYRDFGWAEDYDLWLRMHLAGSRFSKVRRILLFWREGANRLTRKDSRYSVENFLRAKAHYLRKGPLGPNPSVIIWGAGQIGRRLSKHLDREGVRIVAFVDIDPKKIGSTRRGAPIIPSDNLPKLYQKAEHPMILAAVPSRGARELIRKHLVGMDLVEGENFLCVA